MAGKYLTLNVSVKCVDSNCAIKGMHTMKEWYAIKGMYAIKKMEGNKDGFY